MDSGTETWLTESVTTERFTSTGTPVGPGLVNWTYYLAPGLASPP